MSDKPSRPVPSATVILADPAQGDGHPFAIYLLRRTGSSRFMPGRFVFPGGKVEPADGADPASLETLARAALRELFEEAGVLLAHGAAPDPERLAEVRRSLQRGLTTLDLGLDKLSMKAAPGALFPFARWITPTARPQRFDATFFLAAMVCGQEAVADERETTEGVWISPAAALQQNQTGQVALAPPLVIILAQLAQFKDLDELLDAQHDLSPVQPILWIDGETRIIMLPGDPDYAQGQVSDQANPGRLVDAAEATRLVHKDGVWQPYQV